ncbi:MAG TPA: trypsin-like peptidase domain-containing protein [Actinomycetes bacterium]|jgi:S1-C subfamily serine protease|nr:trypsin-like peptidase domain-containing protein [Actinomycetes bacterium]
MIPIHGRRLGRTLPVALALAAMLGACTTSTDQSSADTRPPAAQATRLGQVTVPGQGPDGAIPRLVRQVQPSVVSVATGNGEGSGVVWSDDGVIVTNEHVVRGAQQAEVSFASGQRSAARVLAVDAVTDLAVLRTERKGLPPARFANRQAVVGELALAMGNPLGFENSVTAGIISGLNREIPGSAQQGQSLVDLVQTDAAISPGNSGGALVAADGTILGINEAYIPPNAGAVSIGFAIPAPTVTSVVKQLLENGRARHAYAGLTPVTLTPEIAEQFGIGRTTGAIVVRVAPGAPADRAGIQPGDVIVAADGREVRTAEDFLAVLRAKKPGDQLELTVVRNGQERRVTLKLAERPS